MSLQYSYKRAPKNVQTVADLVACHHKFLATLLVTALHLETSERMLVVTIKKDLCKPVKHAAVATVRAAALENESTPPDRSE